MMSDIKSIYLYSFKNGFLEGLLCMYCRYGRKEDGVAPSLFIHCYYTIEVYFTNVYA